MTAYLVVRYHGYSFWEPWHTWTRLDSSLYIAIAEFGYQFRACEGDPSKWCGNTGWMPLYPYLMGMVSRDFKVLPWVGIGVSWGAAVVVLSLVWRKIARNTMSEMKKALCLLTLAFFPGSFYLFAIYPVSLVLLAIVVAIYATADRRWALVVPAGFAACLTYATGFLLAPVLGLASWHHGHPVGKNLMRAGAIGIAVFSGFLVLCVIFHFQHGTWNAFFLIQEQFGHHLQNPFTTWFRLVFAPAGFGASEILRPIAAQNFVVAGYVVTLCIGSYQNREKVTALDRVLILFTVTYWLFPLAMGENVAMPRAHSLLLPSVILVRHVPTLVVGIYAVSFTFLYFQMTGLYLKNFLF